MIADAKELCDYFSTSDIIEAKTQFAAMDVSNIPDALALPSLFAGYVKTGDILYIPLGSIIVEKSINDCSTGIRQVFCC